MLDIEYIRKNPKDFDANIKRRELEPHAVTIIKLDEDTRELLTKLNNLKEDKNKTADLFKNAKDGDEKEQIKIKAAKIKQQIQTTEEEHRAVNEKLNYLLITLPNMLMPEVPDGKDDNDNVEIRKHGTPKTFNFKPKEHFDLGIDLGEMDFETATKLSGARFVVLRNGLARMHRALGQFTIDMHIDEHGFEEVDVPILLKTESMEATTHLPKFDNGFKTTDNYWLIPSAEASLINLYRDTIIDIKDLPIRVAALTPCFRSEAGAAGKDTRGMFRQHQFYKTELVTITHPDNWKRDFDYTVACAEKVLQKLNIPYRLMQLCAGDCATKEAFAIDQEVWLPGQNRYREVCTWACTTDYQARRAKIRIKDGNEKITPYVIYGSGTGIGRTLIAVIENYQQEDGTILVPEVLQPYMGGMKIIGKEV